MAHGYGAAGGSTICLSYPMKNYRLTTEAYGTIAGTPHRVIVVVPEGSIITLLGPVEERSDEVEVLWEGKSVWLFAQDFSARTSEIVTESLSTQAASAGSSGSQCVDNPPSVKVRRFNASGRELP